MDVTLMCGVFSEDPFTSLEAPLGKGKIVRPSRRQCWRGTLQDTVVVVAGGLCVGLVLCFNAEGISVSARNLLLKTWGPNLQLSCFLGLSAEPHGHPAGLSCQAAGFQVPALILLQSVEDKGQQPGVII